LAAQANLVQELLNQGFPIKLLVRNPEKFEIKNSLVEVVEGNVRDYETVLAVLDGCDVIISTLGLGIPPSEYSIFSRATQNIVSAMNECNIVRYIVVAGLNVNTIFDKKSPKTQFATDWM
jgi:putative NADH-flavin reductase